MLFSKISGLSKDGSYILISAEYHNIKFHINEIETLQIVDTNNTPAIIDDLPIRNAKVLFLLKSGRTKTCYVRKLTKRKYKWLLKLLNN
ncbi:MAG: hypothetical protein UE295_12285 [Acutalibacteraceae bacterium]|nr:hypothetical protein [Acutalibacteraceae bacterium]